MQNQLDREESNWEEIYQEMTRDAFGLFPKDKSLEAEKVLQPKFSKQIDNITASKYELFRQKLLNTITAEFQSILPGAFQITPQSIQCLSYANLHRWSPGRAYFSLFEMKKSKSVWILHLSRSLGEGIAYLVRKEDYGTEINIFSDLKEADSLIYLEIGQILRKWFANILKIWPKSENLSFSRCLHILQLGFQKGVRLKEEYIIFRFTLKNRHCKGDFNVIFPGKYLQKIAFPRK